MVVFYSEIPQEAIAEQPAAERCTLCGGPVDYVDNHLFKECLDCHGDLEEELRECDRWMRATGVTLLIMALILCYYISAR